MVVMEAEDVKLKIYYNKQALVVYCKPPLKMEVFLEKMREACKIPPTQPITAKWIDPEGKCRSQYMHIHPSFIQYMNSPFQTILALYPVS